MKKFGVIGYGGKIGSRLVSRADFVPIKCNILFPESLEPYRDLDFDVIINCAGISSVQECEDNYDNAIKVNTLAVETLHRAFGKRVLTISSDHVFSGRGLWLPTEKTKINPVSGYGFSKVGAETISQANKGKVIRLSRAITLQDEDISTYLSYLRSGKEIEVPSFFFRNYAHVDFVANGIEYFVRNWDDMPQLVNYGGSQNTNMSEFVRDIARGFQLDPELVKDRTTYLDSPAPRPKTGGFSVKLAKKLGFPLYSVEDTVDRLVEEYIG